MESPQSRDLLARLKAAGVNQECHDRNVDDRFAGKTFVFTGALTKFTRDQAQEMVQKRGGKASGSVSKKTAYVVAGAAAGSKLTKAQALGVPVLTEQEFLAGSAHSFLTFCSMVVKLKCYIVCRAHNATKRLEEELL